MNEVQKVSLRQVDKEVIEKNKELFGKDICKYYFFEEAAELTKELTKSIRGQENTEDIIQELADVWYVLSMLIQDYNIDIDEVNKHIAYKEYRAKTRMGIE